MKISRLKLGVLCGTIGAALTISPAFAATPANDSTKSQTPAATSKPAGPNPGGTWSDRIFDEFQEMQQRMDRLFNEATRDVNQQSDWSEGPGFMSSVKLSQDQNDYIVRLSLPDRDLSNVQAKMEADNILRITAKEEKKEQPATTKKSASNQKNPAPEIYELGRYEQLLTLPGPVDASKLKVDRSGTSLTITVPKAGNAKTSSAQPSSAAPNPSNSSNVTPKTH